MAHTWETTILRAGAMRLDGGGMFGVVPRAIWSTLTEPDADNRIALQTNCVLLDDGSRRVLIETGCGDKWSDKERGIYALERRTVLDALREVEVDPASITDVVLTHLHFDHAAGLTALDANGEPASCFPDARIHVQRREWDDAVANRSVMTRTYLRSHLDPIVDQLVFASGPTEIMPGVHVEPAPGHTWGHQVVRFDDGDGPICFAGDVMPTVNHAHPAFSMGYDVEAFTNMESRIRLLDRAVEHGERFILDHEPGPALVRPQRDERGRVSLIPVD